MFSKVGGVEYVRTGGCSPALTISMPALCGVDGSGGGGEL